MNRSAVRTLLGVYIFMSLYTHTTVASPLIERLDQKNIEAQSKQLHSTFSRSLWMGRATNLAVVSGLLYATGALGWGKRKALWVRDKVRRTAPAAVPGAEPAVARGQVELSVLNFEMKSLTREIQGVRQEVLDRLPLKAWDFSSSIRNLLAYGTNVASLATGAAVMFYHEKFSKMLEEVLDPTKPFEDIKSFVHLRTEVREQKDVLLSYAHQLAHPFLMDDDRLYFKKAFISTANFIVSDIEHLLGYMQYRVGLVQQQDCDLADAMNSVVRHLTGSYIPQALDEFEKAMRSSDKDVLSNLEELTTDFFKGLEQEVRRFALLERSY